jgi:hypothetical protein
MDNSERLRSLFYNLMLVTTGLAYWRRELGDEWEV